MKIDASFFTDVADELGIANPSLVEKDYYAVQVIKEISTLDLDSYKLVFSGGTSLAKVYQNTFRMSEDIDFKLIPSEKYLNETNSKQKSNRKNIHLKIKQHFNKIPEFKVNDSFIF
ncbi:MAG: nucleotidyl transferase AbiEii/AbiGii toxin family protein [Gammaproteobacteria bacterium]